MQDFSQGGKFFDSGEFQILSKSQNAALLSYFSRALLRSNLILGQAKNLLA
jgi:hypothetical protein